jgi:hypothetical protein
MCVALEAHTPEGLEYHRTGENIGDTTWGFITAGPAEAGIDVWRDAIGQVAGAARLAGGLFIPYPSRDGNAAVLKNLLSDKEDRVRVSDGRRGRFLLFVKPFSAVCLSHALASG